MTATPLKPTRRRRPITPRAVECERLAHARLLDRLADYELHLGRRYAAERLSHAAAAIREARA